MEFELLRSASRGGGGGLMQHKVNKAIYNQLSNLSWKCLLCQTSRNEMVKYHVNILNWTIFTFFRPDMHNAFGNRFQLTAIKTNNGYRDSTIPGCIFQGIDNIWGISTRRYSHYDIIGAHEIFKLSYKNALKTKVVTQAGHVGGI